MMNLEKTDRETTILTSSRPEKSKSSLSLFFEASARARKDPIVGLLIDLELMVASGAAGMGAGLSTTAVTYYLNGNTGTETDPNYSLIAAFSTFAICTIGYKAAEIYYSRCQQTKEKPKGSVNPAAATSQKPLLR